MSMYKKMAIYGSITALTATMSSQWALAEGTDYISNSNNNSNNLLEVLVIGTRTPIRSVSDSATPVDVFSSGDFTHQSDSDMSDLM